MPRILSVLEEGRESNWYAFVWLEEVSSKGVTVGRTESVSESLDRGMVFRVLANGINYEHATNESDIDRLLEEARGFRVRLEGSGAGKQGPVPPYVPLSWERELKNPLHREFLEQIPEGVNADSWVHFSPECKIDPKETTLALLASRARHYRDRITERSEAYISQNGGDSLAEVRVMLRQNLKIHIFVDRSRNISQTLPVSLVYPIGIARSGLSARSVQGGLAGLEITELDEGVLHEVAVMPHTLSRAKRIQPGRYRVITGPDVTGVIAHEAFGHTQEGDTCMKGRSIATPLREEGRRVGNDQATIMNQAALFSMEDIDSGSNGSFYFDHEGELSRPQAILDHGMLSTPMTDLTSALLLDAPRTANGKRESWRRPLMARQTNTYFTPGDRSLEELIAMVDYGFLARNANGGMEDPKGGSLTAGTEYFEEIQDGRLTGEIYLGPSGGHIELSDPVFTMLDRIVAKTRSVNAENLPENKYGGCGKYHKESVEAGCGGPFILWESINCG